MLFKVAKELLGKCPTKILDENNPTLDFRFMVDLNANLQYYPENILYYCDYTSLHRITKPSRDGDCLLLYLNEKNIDPLSISGFANVIAVDDYEVYTDIISRFQQGLQEESVLVAGNRKLLNKIISNKPISEIANHISEIYNRYVDILDTALNILAVSNVIKPPFTEIFLEHVFKSIKPNVVQYLRDAGILNAMSFTKTPLYIEDPERNTYVYSTPIFIGDILNVGFLTLFVNKKEYLSPVALYYLQETAKLLSLLMQRDPINNTNKSTYFTHLLSGMLQGTPSTAATYQERFMVFNYQLKKIKRIICLHVRNNISASIGVNALCETLRTMLPNSVYVVFDSHIVFLISENHMSDLKKSHMLVEFLTHNMIRIGVSLPFEGETMAKDNFETAKSALSLGERYDSKSFIYFYDAYKILDIIDNTAESKNLNLLCFQPLVDLLQSDDAEKNSLVQTLFTYLNNHFSIQKTCDALFIHRNTLYYRLQKIRDIMCCDFMEYPNLVDIGVTLKILSYLKLLPEYLDI